MPDKPQTAFQGSAACLTSSSWVRLTQQLQNSFQTRVLRKTGTSMGFSKCWQSQIPIGQQVPSFLQLPLSLPLWPSLMSLAFRPPSGAAVVSLFHAWSPFFPPSASSSGYRCTAHLFRRGSAGIISPLEDLWEWSVFSKILILLLDHESDLSYEDICK